MRPFLHAAFLSACFISIHAPQWGATPQQQPRKTSTLFQSTHPSGMRRRHVGINRATAYISIHAPQWDATNSSTYAVPPRNNFNPRTPVGCDAAIYPRLGGCLIISIHAPQWDATDISQHTIPFIKFQSTHPSGMRHFVFCLCLSILFISIHAPQWDATPCVWPTVYPRPYFNPRTPVGCDKHVKTENKYERVFQSTHPSGMRLAATGRLSSVDPKFQSTHPSGMRPREWA